MMTTKRQQRFSVRFSTATPDDRGLGTVRVERRDASRESALLKPALVRSRVRELFPDGNEGRTTTMIVALLERAADETAECPDREEERIIRDAAHGITVRVTITPIQ